MWCWSPHSDLCPLGLHLDWGRIPSSIMLWEGPALGFWIHGRLLDRSTDMDRLWDIPYRVRWPGFQELGGRSRKPVLSYTEPLVIHA